MSERIPTVDKKPLTCSQTFFGMNTSEINNSAWRLKYYFIVAIPLAILTVIPPLIILPTFNFVSRHLIASSELRKLLHWSWIILTLALNLYLDILSCTSSTSGLAVIVLRAVVSMLVMMVAWWYFEGFRRNYMEVRRSKQERRAFVVRTKWWILLFVLAIGCFVASVYTYPFIELSP